MKKITLLIITSILMLLFCGGCDFFQQNKSHLMDIPDFKIKEDLDKSITKIEENTAIITKKTESISTNAQSIYNNATVIESEITDENKEKISPHIKSIKENSKSIIEDTKEIFKANLSIQEIKHILISAKDKIKITDEILEKLVKERDEALEAKEKAEEDRDSALNKAIRWLILASIVGAGALGIFGFMYNSKLSLTLSAVCIVVMSIAIFVQTYFIYLVIFGGIILLGLVGALIWNIIIQKRAFSQVVNTVEITKSELSPESKIKIFGEKTKEGATKKIQSPITEGKIKRTKIKNKISNLLRK